MNKYKFKRQYRPSKRLMFLFRGAFILATIGFLLEMGALFLPAERSYTFNAGPIATMLFLLAFCFVFILLLANVMLWLGMLHFLLSYDGRPFGHKIIWALITFFGLSGGAAMYYWFVYRKFVASMSLGNPQAQPA